MDFLVCFLDAIAALRTATCPMPAEDATQKEVALCAVLTQNARHS